MNKIDKKITEIKQKEQSMENLNHLGDLYLEKGEKVTAVRYFYGAAAVAGRDKAIAIYKKVLSILPSEVPALQSLVNIYAKTGLIAKEVEYLLLLAHRYRGRGEGQEELKVYRRILELDPENESAVHYFGRGKALDEKISRASENDVHGPRPPGPGEEAAELLTAAAGESPVPTRAHEMSLKSEMPYGGPIVSGPLEGRLIENEPVESERMALKDTQLERMPEEERKGLPAMRRWFLWAAAAAVLVVLAAVLISHLGREEGSKGKVISGPMSLEELRAANTWTAEGSTFNVEVTRLAGDLHGETPTLLRLTPSELKENGFFSVTLRAAGGCIPEDLAGSHKNISIIGTDGRLLAPSEMGALAGSDRMVYKEGVCGKVPGIVFARLYIAYPNAASPKGLLVGGVKIVFEKSTEDGYTSVTNGLSHTKKKP